MIIGDGWYMNDEGTMLYQQLVIEPGEDPAEVAKSLIGLKGTAKFLMIDQEPGDPYPSAVYSGTRNALATIVGKAKGSPIGRPRKKN